ncbi:hypothetical protein P2W50_31085 [Pseudomonas protegens]|uniref:hypothetical protein n=1 Tax=Pseudomonas protegens TaxID=380021 RepID=UPI0023ED556C|nr:hypothetical protein [Pseudomonas protegens]MDF4211097.1 hypothetical protein [Pseudomonas protegens]
MQTYDEAIEENELVSRAVAERECKLHDASMEELIEDLGDLPEYYAADLLGWLGY